MGAVEAQNDRGSPGDKRLQKVRAVEVVHVERFLDLDLPSESVKKNVDHSSASRSGTAGVGS